jgi:hypothetical protein
MATRMIAIGAAVVLALVVISDDLVAALVIGLAGFGLLLLAMSSGPQWRPVVVTSTRDSSTRNRPDAIATGASE